MLSLSKHVHRIELNEMRRSPCDKLSEAVRSEQSIGLRMAESPSDRVAV